MITRFPKEHRNQFLIGIGDSDIDVVSKIALVLEREGYQTETYPNFEEALKQIEKTPPHILITDWLWEKDTPHPFCKKLSSLHPETLIISRLEKGASFHDLLSRLGGLSLELYGSISRNPDGISSREVTHIVNQAVQTLYFYYENEQLLETVNKSPKGSESVAEPALEIKPRVRLSDLELGHLSSFFEEVIKPTSHDALIEMSVGYLSELLEDKPVIYLKYLPAFSSLVCYRSAAISLEQIRGVGLKLDGHSPRDQERILREPRSLDQFGKLVQRLLGSKECSTFTLEEDGAIRGLWLFAESTSQTEKLKLYLDAVALSYRMISHQKILHDLNQLDPVSRAYHRTAFIHRIEAEVSRSRRIKMPVSLVTFEIDQWDEFLALKGKRLSDEMCKILTTMVFQTSRPTDLVGRFGENQWGLLLPHTNKRGAALKAEKLRRIFSATKWPHAHTLPGGKMSLSVGVCEYPALSHDATHLMRLSFEALDQVKQVGGNRVCQARPPSSFTPDFVIEPSLSTSYKERL